MISKTELGQCFLIMEINILVHLKMKKWKGKAVIIFLMEIGMKVIFHII